MQVLIMSYNNFSGSFPDLTDSNGLIYISAENNSFTGDITYIDAPIAYFDLHNNHIQFISGFTQNTYYGLAVCNLSGNPLQCPLPLFTFSLCQAQCSASDEDYKSFRIRIEGNVDKFSSQDFVRKLSDITNVTASRISVLGVRSGSVIADVGITGPKGEFNQGSAGRIISILQSTPADVYARNGIQLMGSIVSPIPVPDNSLSTGATIGIAVAVIVVVFCIIIAGLVVLYMRLRRKRRRELLGSVLADIDLSHIQLGAAKKSVVDFDELKGMKQIGSGAFGVVYRADWRNLTVAVKMIKPGSVTPTQLDEFLREVAILQNLRSHPNVVLL